MSFYADRLLNAHWGEQMRFGPGNKLEISMASQGLNHRQAEEVWKPFREWLAASPRAFTVEAPLKVVAGPARLYWNATVLKTFAPGAVIADDRPNAPAGNFYWAGTRGEAGQVLYAYRSAWLPVSLLQGKERPRLVEALFESTRHWGMSLHFNKGLAGAPAEEIAAARDTATNPAVLGAFALVRFAPQASMADVTRFLDQSHKPIEGAEVRSPGVLSQGEWTPVSLALRGAAETVAFLQLDLDLLQNEQFASSSGGAAGPHLINQGQKRTPEGHEIVQQVPPQQGKRNLKERFGRHVGVGDLAVGRHHDDRMRQCIEDRLSRRRREQGFRPHGTCQAEPFERAEVTEGSKLAVGVEGNTRDLGVR